MESRSTLEFKGCTSGMTETKNPLPFMIMRVLVLTSMRFNFEQKKICDVTFQVLTPLSSPESRAGITELPFEGSFWGSRISCQTCNPNDYQG